jgi:N-acetylneuraminate synthase/N,N'-diacetyllegionaminate synthase
MKRVVDIGGRAVGPAHPVLVVAEATINHNGDLDLARRMIRAAAGAGADAVKFQAYHTEEFLASRDLTYTYVSQGREVTESQYDMFKRCELGRTDFEAIRDECRRQGVLFVCTATDVEAARMLVDIGIAAIKVGSDDVVHHPMLRSLARLGKTLILSTGMADMAEVRRAVAAVEEAGAEEVVLLHCTSMYPTPEDRANILCVQTLQREFDCPVGFSDHTLGLSAAGGAVALGACLVERHFTLDRNMAGPDHAVSVDPPALAALVQTIRTTERNLGSAQVAPTPEEMEMRRIARRSIVARTAIPRGTVLGRDHFAYKRPGTGIAPMDEAFVLGRRTKREVAEGEPITLEVVE